VRLCANGQSLDGGRASLFSERQAASAMSKVVAQVSKPAVLLSGILTGISSVTTKGRSCRWKQEIAEGGRITGANEFGQTNSVA